MRFFMAALLITLMGIVSVQAATIKLATTTSTENSGLLKDLLPKFSAATGIEVDVIAVGTGKALKLGENGDVDVLMVHDRKGEDDFVAAGHAVKRYDLMYNDFVLVGPPQDKLQLQKSGNAIEAFKSLSKGQVKFISRGDDSGTHRREKAIWAKIGVAPKGDWYVEAGQGMEQTLIMADQLGAYTLCDRSTYIAMKTKVKLGIVFQGDPELRNPYGVMAVNPAKHPGVKADDAQKFINWLIGPEGRAAITGFKVGGQQLFFLETVPHEGFSTPKR